MQKGTILELEITDYAFEGKGIAKINTAADDDKKFVVFVHGAFPGDKIEAKITKFKKTYAEAVIEKILVSSKLRIEPKCKFHSNCGGCKQQDMNYVGQTNYKSEQVKDIFERLGGFKDFEMESIIGAENIFFYRNKMEYSFAVKRWLTKEEINDAEIIDRDFALGLHIPGLYDKVLDIDECFLQSELSNKILNFTRNFFKQRNIPIYSTNTHEGYLRNLVIRTSFNTRDVMINLVTSSDNNKLLIEYTNELLKICPEVTTVINNINAKKAQIAIGDYEKVYFGDGFIYDYIDKFKFRISPNSFFQTNTSQAEKLYKTAFEYADIKEDEIVYDLFCGAGTISIYISDKAKKVYGFETVESAIKDGEINILGNKIKNVKLIQVDLNKSFTYKIKEEKIELPDVIIADPPRSGMNPQTVRDILELKPKRIVYVSCNPTTQARDIKLLVEGGYKLIKAKPVDMFPHTYHIENAALLKLG
ncbi:MAG: 23S rRNA (uracil(1939)-C(5))-methyltransferase RlmD [bacterium]